MKRNSASTVDQRAWDEGQTRALALLRDLEETSCNDIHIDEGCRNGEPQANVVHGHLLGAFSTRNDDVISSFCAVLTHYLGGAVRSRPQSLDELAAATDSPIPTRAAGDRARISMMPFRKLTTSADR